MKSTFNLIVAILALLTFGSFAMAQDKEVIEKQIESQIKVAPQRAGTMQVEGRTMQVVEGRPSVIKCLLGLQQTINAGIYDNLTLPTESTVHSPAELLAFPTSIYNYKEFDDPTVNKIVAYSFSLKNYKPCEGRMCSALLEIAVCNSGADLWQNDKVYVGDIENNKFVPSILYGDIWKSNEAKKCKIISVPINPSTIASWPWLEVMVQDDTSVDSMKLTLNY